MRALRREVVVLPRLKLALPMEMVVLPLVMVESPIEVVVIPLVIEDLPMVMEVLPRAIEEAPRDRAVFPSVILVFPMKACRVVRSSDSQFSLCFLYPLSGARVLAYQRLAGLTVLGEYCTRYRDSPI